MQLGYDTQNTKCKVKFILTKTVSLKNNKKMVHTTSPFDKDGLTSLNASACGTLTKHVAVQHQQPDLQDFYR